MLREALPDALEELAEGGADDGGTRRGRPDDGVQQLAQVGLQVLPALLDHLALRLHPVQPRAPAGTVTVTPSAGAAPALPPHEPLPDVFDLHLAGVQLHVFLLLEHAGDGGAQDKVQVWHPCHLPRDHTGDTDGPQIWHTTPAGSPSGFSPASQAQGKAQATPALPVLPLGTAQGQDDLGRAGFGCCGTLRKDSMDLEARELLRNRVLGSPAKQERVHGLGDGHGSSLGNAVRGGHS